jgi:TPR repeat protein
MRLAGRSILIAVFLALSGAATAGPLEDATAAYQRRDYATAYALMRPLADQGLAAAQYNVGEMYAKGQGVEPNYPEAVKWFRKAADQGVAPAQFNLGLLYAPPSFLGPMYANGQGVTLDYVEALKWFRKAADQGLADAQFLVGVMYVNGQGVAQDYVQAHMWFDLAAAQGDPKALAHRGQVAGMMTPDQIAEAQNLAREWKPTVKPTQ